MKMKSSQDIVELVSESLNETGFTFFYKRESDPDMLKTKGALSIVEDLVQEYEDKPQEDQGRFNAFWTAFAFRKRVFNQCIEFMEKSTLDTDRWSVRSKTLLYITRRLLRLKTMLILELGIKYTNG